MSFGFHTVGGTPLLLPASPKVCVLGDSISDVAPWNLGNPPTQAAYGQWVTALQNRFRWQRYNANMIRDPSFEVNDPDGSGNANGGAPTHWTGVGVTITCDNTRAKYGSQSMKMVSTSAVTSYAYPEADYGGGALQQGLQAGQTYVLSAWFYLTGAVGGTPAVQALWNSGGLVVATGNVVSTTGAWVQSSLCFTVPANATDAAIRVTWGTGTLAQNIWVDAVQLEPVPNLGTPYSPTTFNRWSNRGAIAGSLLSNFGATSSNLQDNLSARSNAFDGGTVVPDLFILQDGMNDLTHTDTAGAAPTSLTLAAWKTSMNTVLTALLALNGTCQVIVGGISNSYQTITTKPAWYTSLDDAVTQMDDATRQVIAGLGASGSRVRFVKVRPWPFGYANLDSVVHVHPTAAVAGGMDQLAARYVAGMAGL